MIKRGKKDYPHLKLKHYQNIELPYPDESFDLIIICAVLTCIPNNKIKLSVLSEIHRLLRKEGVLHMVEFSNHEGKSFSSSFGIQMEHQKPNELRKTRTSNLIRNKI